MAAQLKIAPRVTAKHGRLFAEALIAEIRAVTDAFGRTGVVEWPDPDDDPEGAARFLAVEEAIVTAMLEELREPIAEAFVRAARSVLAMERRRQR